MQEKIRWGILGCGRIAHKIAEDLGLVENATLSAVASRDQLRAREFGNQYDVSKCYGSYEELVQDREIDVIYVATRHPQHASATLLCLNHGKAVMCEKPFAMNTEQVDQMIALAKDKNVFLMEGLWTLFIPAVERTLQLIKDGEIGDVKVVQADFGFLADTSKVRLFDKNMGGGSLLDIGIYPLLISLLTLGIPTDIRAGAVFTEQGIDESCTISLTYQSGAIASLNCTFAANTQTEAWINGTKRSIKLHRQFHCPSALSIYESGELLETIELSKTGYGYAHELEHVSTCIQQGMTESPKATHQLSRSLIKLLDDTREVLGLTY